MARFIGTATLLGLAISPAAPSILQSSAIAQIILKSKSSLNRLSNLPPSKFWSSVKFLCKSSTSVPTFLHQAKIHSSDLEKVDCLNLFFSSCFNNSAPLMSTVLPTSILLLHWEDYHFSHIQSIIQNSLWSWWHHFLPPESYCSFSCSPSLNASIKSDLFQQSWKFPNVVPAPLPLPSLWFRPISFLSLVIKLLEKHIPYPLD